MDAKDTNKNNGDRLASVAASAGDCKAPLVKMRQLLSSLQRLAHTAEANPIFKELETAINSLAANLEKIEAAATLPAAGPQEKALQGLRVLLADDDDIAGAMTSRVLERNGAVYMRAFDGKAATELAAAHDFDIILMDVQMPVMDGLAASRIIRNQLKKNAPIIALTAEKNTGNSNYKEAGMNEALPKPFKEKVLVDTILKYLRADKQQTDLRPEATPALYSLDKLTSMGDQAFVLRMLNLFIEQVPASVIKLKEAYQASDFDTVKYIAHRIRPSLQNMNIAALQEAGEIERLAETRTASTELEDLIAKLDVATATVVAALREYLAAITHP